MAFRGLRFNELYKWSVSALDLGPDTGPFGRCIRCSGRRAAKTVRVNVSVLQGRRVQGCKGLWRFGLKGYGV